MDFQEVDNVEHKEQKQKLKMVISSNGLMSYSQKLNFIDWVQRLGVSYHFEHEIEEALDEIHNNLVTRHEDDDYNLHSLALLFRLLRQHGYPISSGMYV